MTEKTTTESIIRYFHYHKGEVFEVDILHKTKFSDINYDSFRKLVSRISNRGEELTHLCFSLYCIGKADEMMLDDIVFNYFSQKKKAYYCGDTLLYYLGLSDKVPEVVEMKGNVLRAISARNIKVIPFQYGVGDLFKSTYIACELLQIANHVDDDHYDKYCSVLCDYAEKISVEFIEKGSFVFGVSLNYPRYVYFKLANLLQSVNLYDEVMKWYEELANRETGQND